MAEELVELVTARRPMFALPENWLLRRQPQSPFRNANFAQHTARPQFGFSILTYHDSLGAVTGYQIVSGALIWENMKWPHTRRLTLFSSNWEPRP